MGECPNHGIVRGQLDARYTLVCPKDGEHLRPINGGER